jgi:hypothetical protein
MARPSGLERVGLFGAFTKEGTEGMFSDSLTAAAD